MILVVGANGTVGSRVVALLRERGEEVRALVRDTRKAAQLGDSVEVVTADLARPETLAPAFAGVAKLFLLTAGPDALERNAIDAARTAGVRHVVKLSSMGFGPRRDALAIGGWHRAAEAHLEASGIPWTILLAGGFASNALGWARTIKAQGAAFAATGDGRVAVVHPDDLAAAAVVALTEPGHEGRRYELTGPEALSFAEQVACIGEAIGRPLRFTDVPKEAARGAMIEMGMPEPMVSGMLEVMANIKAGGAATVSGDLERLLRRKPRTFAEWARESADAFR